MHCNSRKDERFLKVRRKEKYQAWDCESENRAAVEKEQRVKSINDCEVNQRPGGVVTAHAGEEQTQGLTLLLLHS